MPVRHVASFFELTSHERMAMLAALEEAKHRVETRHRPDGYNLGAERGPRGRPDRTALRP